MSVGAISSYTANYRFRLLNYDFLAWHTYEHLNWSELDTTLNAIASSKGISGVWTNSLVVAQGERYIDSVDGNTYIALVAHTTPSSGTFSSDRTANPSRWLIDAVANNSITLSKLQQIPTQTLLGKLTAGTGNIENPTVTELRDAMNVVSHGQCQLVYLNTSTIKLLPMNGNKLIIGDRVCTIPTAGVQLTTSGLSGNNDYYIYAKDDNGDGVVDGLVALEKGLGLALDGTTGVTIPGTNDRTRSLVGLVHVGPSVTWDNTLTKRWVRSYFNRQKLELNNSFTVARNITNTAALEIHSEIRIEFVAFSDDIIHATASAPVANSVDTGMGLGVSVDGAAPSSFGVSGAIAALSNYVANTRHVSVSDGYHYISAFGFVGAGTGTYGVSPYFGNINGSIQ